jgi:hypothetical protein
VLVLAVSAGALASTLSDIVPPSGTVAGQKYPYFLRQTYALYFSAPAPGPPPCETISVGGKKVTLVEDIRGGNTSCHVPTGRPIFVNELGRGCADIPGQHDGYGTGSAALALCARQIPEQALISEWLDGRRVTNPSYGRYFWSSAGVFSVSIAPHRFKGFHKGQARAAAWGWALLLKGLPKGTHTVRCKARHRNGKIEFTSRVFLHVH